MRQTPRLDTCLAGLAEPTRRAILAPLPSGQGREADTAEASALVRRWLLGPPGWSMPVCEIDLRVGGKYRYVWQHDGDGTKMGMGGVYREIKAPERIVNTEKFDEAWYPGEALGTLVLVEQGGKTTLTYTMRYESRAARDAVIKSNMESGVAASYDRLAELLASTPARGRA